MGWDLDRFLGKERIKDYLICTVCAHVIEDPAQTQCQHTFCKRCIIRWLEDGQRICPKDRQQLTSEVLMPPCPLTNQLLSELIVRCKYYAVGCCLMSKLEDMPRLIEHEVSQCKFAQNMSMQQMGQQMHYPQQGHTVQAQMPQPQRFFKQAKENVYREQPRLPQQPRGTIPPSQMQMDMNAGFSTRGPFPGPPPSPGPWMNPAQVKAAATLVANPTEQQVVPAMTRGVGQIPHILVTEDISNPDMVAVSQQEAVAAAIAAQQEESQVAAVKQNRRIACFSYFTACYSYFTMLAETPPQKQKQMLGEHLYPFIREIYPGLARKITGMLLEIDNCELVHMLAHGESLKRKVDEAVTVLQDHQSKFNELTRSKSM